MDKELTVKEVVELPGSDELDRECNWVRPSFTAVDGIGEAPLFELEGMILAFGFTENENQKVIGSGVMIAPGVCLTATHIIDEMKPSFPFLFTFPCESMMRIWKIEDIHALEHVSDTPLIHKKNKPEYSDVSIMSCSPFSRFRDSKPYYYPPLEVCLPKVGERLWAVGYREISNDGVPKIAYFTSSGIVTRQYTEGRGAQLRSACVEVRMKVKGGMSGGPVFNEAGRVVGVISSCLEGPNDNNGPTFVTLIWPALMSTIHSPWPSGIWPDKVAGVPVQTEQYGIRVSGGIKKVEDGFVLKMHEDSEEHLISVLKSADKNFDSEYEDLSHYLDEVFEYELQNESLNYLACLTKSEFQKINMSDFYENQMKLFQPSYAETNGGMEDLIIHSATLLESGSVGLELSFNIKDSVISLELNINEFFYHESQQGFLPSFYNQIEDDDNIYVKHCIRPYFRISATFNPTTYSFENLNFLVVKFR